jgi:hypothetical protein
MDCCFIRVPVIDITQQVRDGLRQYFAEEKEMTMTMSSISGETFDNIMRMLELTTEDGEHIIPPVIEFIPFNWNGRDEDNAQAMTDAFNHLTAQLTNFATPVEVQFGRGGYKVVDVHRSRSILKVHDARFRLSGGTDFVIVPYKTAAIGAASQICVLFELKTDVALNTTSHCFQAMAELIAARYNSNQPNVLAVLTDLHSRASVYELVYNGNAQYTIVVWNDLTLAQMATKVVNFLKTSTIANNRYVPPDDMTAAQDYERGVVDFRRNKIQRVTSLALEQLQDMMMDPTSWTYSEKRQLFANVFASIEEPMSENVRCAMYS